jgi:hypothetical protein
MGSCRSRPKPRRRTNCSDYLEIHTGEDAGARGRDHAEHHDSAPAQTTASSGTLPSWNDGPAASASALRMALPRSAPLVSRGASTMPPSGRYRMWPHGYAMKRSRGKSSSAPRVLTKVENAVKVEPVGEFESKGIRRPLAAYNVVGLVSAKTLDAQS